MDRILHAERLNGRTKRTYKRMIDDLPNGAIVALNAEAFAVRGKRLLRWTSRGYSGSSPRARGIKVDVLTPPSILAVLARGYAPLWHPSAD